MSRHRTWVLFFQTCIYLWIYLYIYRPNLHLKTEIFFDSSKSGLVEIMYEAIIDSKIWCNHIWATSCKDKQSRCSKSPPKRDSHYTKDRESKNKQNQCTMSSGPSQLGNFRASQGSLCMHFVTISWKNARAHDTANIEEDMMMALSRRGIPLMRPHPEESAVERSDFICSAVWPGGGRADFWLPSVLPSGNIENGRSKLAHSNPLLNAPIAPPPPPILPICDSTCNCPMMAITDGPRAAPVAPAAMTHPTTAPTTADTCRANALAEAVSIVFRPRGGGVVVLFCKGLVTSCRRLVTLYRGRVVTLSCLCGMGVESDKFEL